MFETPENLIERLKTIDKICAMYSEAEDMVNDIRHETAVPSAEKLAADFAGLEADKVVRIGIIGGVKAGKSSLLNALFFGGKDILPKAATPMTAALTVLSYAEIPSATVEFYSEEEFKNVEDMHRRYKAKREEIIREKTEQIKKDMKSSGGSLSDEDIADMAKADSENALDAYIDEKAAYELQELRNKSTHDSAAIAKEGKRVLQEHSNTTALVGELDDYVGTEGSMTAFTKSVELRCPEVPPEVFVVDTPGVNDVIASRVKTTNDFLAKCHVVFVVSRANQFLGGPDYALINRVQKKEGVDKQYVYIVASQFDGVLCSASVIRDSKENLKTAIDSEYQRLEKNVIQNLTEHKETALASEQLGEVIADAKSHMVVTSAMAFQMADAYEEKDNWGPEQKVVWGNLSKHYPHNFTEGRGGKASLELISGIPTLNEKIKAVVKEGEKAIVTKRKKMLDDKTKGITTFCNKLIEEVKKRRTFIEKTDLTKIQNEKLSLNRVFNKVTNAVERTFEDCIDDLVEKFRESAINSSSDLFRMTREDIASAEGEVSRMETVKESGIFPWFARVFGTGGYTTESYTVETINATNVSNSINGLIDKLQRKLDESVGYIEKEWKRKIPAKIIEQTMLAAEGDMDSVEPEVIDRALRRVVNDLVLPDLDIYTESFPEEYGILSGYEAVSFRKEVTEFAGQLKKDYQTKSRSIVGTLKKIPQKVQFSKLMFADMDRQLTQLEADIENKQLTLSRLDDFLVKLKKA
jgi:predicted GTPase